MEEQVFSGMAKNTIFAYVVGGNTQDPYLDGVNDLANFFVKNNYTMVWGDDVKAREDKTNIVALLAKKIIELGGISPIQVTQDGGDLMVFAMMEDNLIPEKDKRLQKIVDNYGNLLGYENTAYKDGRGRLIHTNKQQDRSKLYYSNADIIVNLDGAYGVGYEMITQVIYKFSGDIRRETPIITVDNNQKFEKLINAYIQLSVKPEAQDAVRKILNKNYYSSMEELRYNITHNFSLEKQTKEEKALKVIY